MKPLMTESIGSMTGSYDVSKWVQAELNPLLGGEPVASAAAKLEITS